MNRQRSVKIFLADGSPTGILFAEIGNWTGNVIVAPRGKLADLAKRKEIHRTGIYILSGADPEELDVQLVYIGEGDNVLKRLQRHSTDEDKEFWERTAIITSKDQNLTKAHARYLERRLIELGNVSGRARLVNGTAPEIIGLPESDKADMEYFLEQLQILLPLLGFNFITPLPTFTRQSDYEHPAASESPILEMKYAGAEANAKEVDGEFVVSSGSMVRKDNAASLRESDIRFRQQLVQNGKIRDGGDPQFWILSEDLVFKSPSAAAKFVGGASLNGRITWKIKDSNQTYADWQESQIAAAATESSKPYKGE